MCMQERALQVQSMTWAVWNVDPLREVLRGKDTTSDVHVGFSSLSDRNKVYALPLFIIQPVGA